MKKILLNNKFIILILILIINICDVNAEFPSKLNNIAVVPRTNDENGEAWSNKISFSNEEWQSNYKKASLDDGSEVVVICANHNASSPAKVYNKTTPDIDCPLLDDELDDAIKAGVAAIINEAGPFELVTDTEYVTVNEKAYTAEYYDKYGGSCYSFDNVYVGGIALKEGEYGCVKDDYVKAAISISKFLSDPDNNSSTTDNVSYDSTYNNQTKTVSISNPKGKNKSVTCDTSDGGCAYVEEARNAYNQVKAAKDAAKNDTFVLIDNVTIDEHDDEFILSFSVPSIYTIDSINVSKGSKQAEGIYKILKSDLDEGDNSVTITVDASYTVAVAEFYDCGWNNASSPYQLITPAYTEDKKVVKDTVTKDITLTKQTKGTIELIKENTSGTKILAKDVGIQLYDGYNCTIGNENNEYTSFQSGNKLSLEAGDYSIKETTAPLGYEKDDTCHNFTISAGHTADPITITNQSTCVSDVLDLIQSGKANDRSERIKIFKNYNPNLDSEVKIYANLLNFDLTYNGGDNTEFANSLCSNPTNCGSVNINCLYASTSTNFNANNLSCYNSTQKINNNTGFCYTSFSFKPSNSIHIYTDVNDTYYNLSNSNGTTTSGQFVFKNEYLGTAILSQTCYFGTDIGTEIDVGEYGDYVGTIKFNNDENKLSGYSTETVDGEFKEDPTKENSSGSLVLKKGINGLYSGFVNAHYLMPEIYVEPITGKKCVGLTNDNGEICKNLGRGLISNFNDVKNENAAGYVEVPFEINFNTDKTLLEVGSNGKKCIYYPLPRIIKYEKSDNGTLEIEFRTVDTNNPFNRNTKSNWSGTTNSSTNNKVQQYITNSDVNNSYNRTGAGSLYTNQTDGTKRIILTPSLIQTIREYNESHSYNDYTVHKEENDDGIETTTTNFFKCIGLTKVQ